ncbi:MAG: LemA family protein [Lentisphaeria bacterium]|nr:LemA family protein [Lentisphaeria bacterium]
MSIPGLIFLILIIAFIFIFNSLIMKRNVAENSLAVVNAFLKRQFEVAGDLLAAVPDTAPESVEELKRVIAQKTTGSDMKAKAALESDFHARLADFIAAIDSESSQITDLKNELTELSQQAAKAKTAYNQAVTTYNQAISTFPGTLFARLMHLQSKELF